VTFGHKKLEQPHKPPQGKRGKPSSPLQSKREQPPKPPQGGMYYIVIDLVKI